MSGYLWKATVRNVNRALKEVNAFEWEGDYRFAARRKLKELLEGGMETEVERHLGRERYERRECGEQQDYRNGKRPRHFLTELGDLILRIPRTRKGYISRVLEAYKRGRWGLLATGAGLTLAGGTIMYLGATEVFVAEDLAFMGLTRVDLSSVNERLIPLIAHDRAGFGGGLTTTGLLLVLCGWYARPSRAFYEAVLISGCAGFGCAIGTHFVEGYLNPVHLAPAFAGAALFLASIALAAAPRPHE